MAPVIDEDDKTDYTKKEKVKIRVKRKMTIDYLVCENIQNRYVFEKCIGEGAFGKVNIASLKVAPDKKYAIKSIPRELFEKRAAASSGSAGQSQVLDEKMM